MKKLFFVALVFGSIALNAKVWHVSTTCGVQGNINIADNASLEQITQAVSQYNYNNCGVRPKSVTITVTP